MMTAELSQFIDIHTHILPGIDDGPKSLEESAAMAQCYVDVGISRIIATPHFIPGTAWAAGRERIRESLQVLQTYLAEKSIALDIFSGMEIAFHQKLISRLERNILQPLAQSRYYLLEPSFQDPQGDLLCCIRQLMDRGEKVILAHPERIPSFQEELGPLTELVRQGLEVQLNMGSLLDRFNELSKQTSMQLIANNSVHYLASDSHSAESRKPPTLQDWEKLTSLLGDKLLTKLCIVNPWKLLDVENTHSCE